MNLRCQERVYNAILLRATASTKREHYYRFAENRRSPRESLDLHEKRPTLCSSPSCCGPFERLASPCTKLDYEFLLIFTHSNREPNQLSRQQWASTHVRDRQKFSMRREKRLK